MSRNPCKVVAPTSESSVAASKKNRRHRSYPYFFYETKPTVNKELILQGGNVPSMSVCVWCWKCPGNYLQAVIKYLRNCYHNDASIKTPLKKIYVLNLQGIIHQLHQNYKKAVIFILLKNIFEGMKQFNSCNFYY